MCELNIPLHSLLSNSDSFLQIQLNCHSGLGKTCQRMLKCYRAWSVRTVFTLHRVNTARRSNANLNLQQCADRCEYLL
ncbi:hypothetical protein I7I53_09725 [Histoplasma capsulatum var. duboisii H88]|uniref:Uncharacterized protein n=1 Tax=Ajellomyces capsulatus (strain H88) TaxID=544711 RepID=A0A8A1L9N3_AJEC8|nr:hypothetical protein I7I53_09725 [Histoplasma capsulatum var. duboisii H88]